MSILVEELRTKILATGVQLYSGCDDAEDPCLGHHMRNGYASVAEKVRTHNLGTFSSWAIQNNIARRVFIPEIPMNASYTTKKSLLHLLLRHLCKES